MNLFNNKNYSIKRKNILGTFNKCLDDLLSLNKEIVNDNLAKKKQVAQLDKQIQENEALLNQNGKSIAKIKEIVQ